VAPSESTILIEGETGTGKEVTARAIHSLSSRRDEPFLGVNCGALPETLLESTLFGHRKGAFTGAVEDQPGLFARAGRGTLFLDEIGDISPALQVRLLRVLQEQEYEPVGGRETVRAEARIIAASNKSLRELMEKGLFRQDLYYRLNVIRISLPPLRERTEDILSLADFFIEEFNRKHDKKIEGFGADVLDILQSHSWPGNIRELENVMERACVLCRDTFIGLDCFAFDGLDTPPPRGSGSNLPDAKVFGQTPTEPPSSEPALPGLSRKEIAERAEIIDALSEAGGSRIKAAALLGIHKTTLFRKLKRYQITSESFYSK
jgi:transcriptional regulator with PAS, ATPase and Fis domain